ncbi:MAG: CysS/YqeB C-terminal domain-containing protein [Pseudonocardiaceae bacterium]
MTQRPRLLTLMGSGETAPTMAKVHRLLVGRLGPPPVDVVLLDTPYGFQENADEISRRAVGYLERNLGMPPRVASWRNPASELWLREQALSLIRAADLVFAGPGSPTYALRVWKGGDLRDLLAGNLARGGCVTFGSAAAACLGIATVPVYEFYKVGADPHWVEGLDLLAVLGLQAAVIPHFDNAEGGTHDTRFCYLGERRLQAMERMGDVTTFVLGIDEHTAGVFDLDADTLTVLGRGGVTVRHHGVSTVFGTGITVGMDQVRAAAAGERPVAVTAQGGVQGSGAGPEVPSLLSLHAEMQRLEGAFDAGLGSRDVATAVTAVLELEQTIVDWSADTEEEDSSHAPRAVLRRMVLRLGELAAVGLRDPTELIAPLVDTLVEIRDRARAQRSWSLADELRERLTMAGVTVRDTPTGTVWELTSH